MREFNQGEGLGPTFNELEKLTSNPTVLENIMVLDGVLNRLGFLIVDPRSETTYQFIVFINQEGEINEDPLEKYILLPLQYVREQLDGITISRIFVDGFNVMLLTPMARSILYVTLLEKAVRLQVSDSEEGIVRSGVNLN